MPIGKDSDISGDVKLQAKRALFISLVSVAALTFIGLRLFRASWRPLLLREATHQASAESLELPVRTSGGPRRTAQLDRATKNLILKCAAENVSLQSVHSPEEFVTLTEYFNRAMGPESGLGPAHSVLQYRNVHLLDREGRRLRLYITPKSEIQGEYQSGLFLNDEDGLGVPTNLPPDFIGLTLPQLVERFKSEGELVLDEESDFYEWAQPRNHSAKLGAHVIRRNERVENLEVYFSSGGALICSRTEGRASAQCQCLR